MRILLALLLTTTQAAAWQAGSDGLLCTLTHAENGTEVLLTYDPSGPLYTITVTGPAAWDANPVFGIAFLGGREMTITTDRHTLSEDGRALTVSDRGFGNVLDGLSYNRTAVMVSGDTLLPVSLAGAAPEAEIFRNCGSLPSS